MRKIKLNIIGIYNSNTNEFYDIFDSVLSDYKNSIIVGDMNINLLHNNKHIEKYCDTIHSNNFKILKKIHQDFFTRIHGNSRSIIDHALTDILNTKYYLSIASHHFTDHESICVQVKIAKNKNLTKTYNTTNLKHVVDTKGILKEFISKRIERNPDLVYEYSNNFSDFHNELKEIIVNNTSIKTSEKL